MDCVNVCSHMMIGKRGEGHLCSSFSSKIFRYMSQFSFLNEKRSSGSGWQGCVLMACMCAMCG